MFTPVAVEKKKSHFKPDWYNSQKPFEETLYRAIDYLGFKVRNCNAIEAYRTIEKIVSEQQKYRLFQKLFPVEWQKSQTSFFKTGYYENYSERINEFFGLVNEKMFPLLSGWNDDPEMEFENFCIFSLNVDLCCEDIDYEHLRVSYVAALIFFFRDEEIWEYFASHYKIEAEDFPAINERPSEKIWDLEKTGKQELYLNIFELVDHSTGNPWIDTVNCRAGEDWYEWEEATLEYLATSYKEAQVIFDKSCLLDELIEAEPKDTLLEMIVLWNEGKSLKEKKQAAGKRRKKERQLDFYEY